MLWFICKSLLLVALFLASAYFFFLLPPKYPLNIPAIPFWVVLIPFFKDVDQSDIFKKYIEKPLRTHGVVKLFFGAQWNIVVHRPSYLAEIFKDEDLFQKSGNQKKIPHSVLAAFLGDNVISSHGTVWKDYQSVIKPGLQRSFEAEVMIKNAARLSNIVRAEQMKAGEHGITVQETLQRYTIANSSEVLLQTDLHSLDSKDATINTLQIAVKREIFKPIFMNFPLLDRLPIPSRMRARELVQQFREELKNALLSSYEKTPASMGSDKLGSRLLAAWESGLLSEKQFLDNLTVTFVASQENPQLLIISTLYLLAKHPEAQAELYEEIQSSSGSEPVQEALQDMPYLTSVIYESLRLFPPIGQLINRRAADDAFLGNEVYIPKGTYLGYNCYSTNRDSTVWGPSADDFCPQRWGASIKEINKQYRQRRAKAEFISFHGGKRACLGERFAMLEMRVTLFVLVRQLQWSLDPTWVDRKTAAGPLYPRALRLVFRDRVGGDRAVKATSPLRRATAM